MEPNVKPFSSKPKHDLTTEQAREDFMDKATVVLAALCNVCEQVPVFTLIVGFQPVLGPDGEKIAPRSWRLQGSAADYAALTLCSEAVKALQERIATTQMQNAPIN